MKRKADDAHARNLSAEAVLRRIAGYGYTRFRNVRAHRWVYVKQISKAEYDRA